MNRTFPRFLALTTTLGLTACAATGPKEAELAAPAATVAAAYTQVANPHFADIAEATLKREKDHAAILAMGGDFKVDFNFMETVVLESDYETEPSKNTGGYETVVVVKDSPEHIVLQHILVGRGGFVVKHWRQDWHWQAPERFEFAEDQTWVTREIPPEKTANAWTQCVYEVSDAPRYCGTGRWNHRYGVSTWTSDRTWRPLPRREYTTRDDYNAINAENRHTVTPNGWTHEQDNTKTLRDGVKTARTLVREYGFNDYRSITGYDFSPANQYWDRTRDYWARVRAAWDRRLAASQTLVINTAVDGMPIIEATFDHAARVEEMSSAQQLTAIEQVLNEYVTPAMNLVTGNP